MHRRSIKFAVLVAVALCTMLVMALPAFGDAVYHSRHIALVASTGTTVGFVENITPTGRRFTPRSAPCLSAPSRAPTR